MVEVYFYIPAQHTDHTVECGLKLSQWFDREVEIAGEIRKCMAALLNPKDDMDKYRSEDYRCLKLQLEPRYCFVADRYMYEVGMDNPEIMELYQKSVISIEDYIFGSYRLPECLVTSTVIPGYISILNKKLDSPVLFDRSEELYLNNVIEAYKEIYDDFNDTLLYFFYSRLSDIGKMKKIESKRQDVTVFLEPSSGKTMVVRNPDMEKFKGDR